MRRKPLSAFDLTTAAAGLLLVYLGAQSVGPAVAAARADGVWGVFTARRLTCVTHPGHEQCTWQGDFRPARGGTPRRNVALYGSGRGTLTPGAVTRAFDTGRDGHVYGPEGSSEWVMSALLLTGGGSLLTWPVRRYFAWRRTLRAASLASRST
ncbi:hypothetical protein [Sinosporangium siamense]|uniref:Uncharacterized protein n=1 Tax=Sinosporangium siamense TaxID=1367973 RepID=A0A919V5M5_9ACTN|nr:hypothetical protein [Sinosporangium siamense]GII91683.1 hypothetical protein Ssi02_19140 [Sinosporangium siamense]